MIHFGLFLYVIFALKCIRNVKPKDLIKYISVFFVLLCILFVKAFSGNTVLRDTFTEFIGSQRSVWLVMEMKWGFLVYWVYQILLFGLLNLGEKYAVYDNTNSAIKIRNLKSTLWMLILFLPIYMFSFAMYRYLRNFTVCFYICIVYYIQNIKSKNKRFIYFILVIVVVCFMTVSHYYEQIDLIVELWKENILIG
jgi:hypothetical protein